MKEIYPNLHIGSQDDYECIIKNQDGWFVIHACKEPYHRQALGYSGRAALKSHPEYLIAKRLGHLILNLVDAPSPDYISKMIIDAAIEAIDENIESKKVLIHCNQGVSRSATIGLLYLHHIDAVNTDDFLVAEQEYLNIYPWYNPGSGMRMFAMQNWNDYKFNE